MRALLILLMCAGTAASAQSFTERFDDVPPGTIPPGWGRFQSGAPPARVWAVSPISGQAQQAVESDYGFAGSGESGLLTPPISLNAGDVLRFRAAELTSVPSTTQLEVRAGPGSGPGPFPIVLGTIEAADLPRSDGPFGLIQVDLSAVKGQIVRLAFVHVNTVTGPSDVGGALYIDDVTVGAPPVDPLLAVSRIPEAFGIVGIGRSRTTRARIENEGGTPLTLGEAASTSAGISIEAPPAGTVLAVGGTAEVVFRFAPTATGGASATVDIPSTGGSVRLSTTGTGGQISLFTGTTVGGTGWMPPRINGTVCDVAPAAGTFATTDVTVSASGRYRFQGQFGEIASPPPAFGTFTLYDGPFDPGEPCAGAVLVLGPTLRVSGEADLTAGVAYRLASSTYTGLGNTPPGPFSGELVGPGAVAFATSEAAEPSASELSIGVVGANPSRGRIAVTVRTEAPGPVRVEAFDILGRRVAVLFEGILGPEARAVGAVGVAPGIYLVRLNANGASVSQRVTVVR